MVTVAFDVGPLHGRRTGIGNAVAWTLDALRSAPDPPDLLPYLTSVRATVTAPTRRLPIPAAAAHRIWSKTSWPPMDGRLGRPDVVHGTNYVVPPTRCPRIVSVYDCWFLDHPRDAHPDVRRAGGVLRRAVDDGADVVTSSEATAQRVRELLGAERVHTVHLGPPPHLVPPDVPPENFVEFAGRSFLLALGTVERRKNLPMLVAAFGRVAAEVPDLHLLIVGSAGDDSRATAAAIAALDPAARSRVTSIGAVTDDEKAWLLARATALAYPSLDEGFGFPILEAQLAGTPVVASSAGSIPEVAGPAALLSLPTDVDALAANLHWVATNDDLRATLVQKGRSNVERFSWRSTAETLATIYREVSRCR